MRWNRRRRPYKKVKPIKERVKNYIPNYEAILLTEDNIKVQTLYVSQIFRETNEDDLKLYFSKYGEITDVKLISNHRNYKYGFITFERCESAATALKSHVKHDIYNGQTSHRVKVSAANSWHQPDLKTKENKEIITNKEMVKTNKIVDQNENHDNDETIINQNITEDNITNDNNVININSTDIDSCNTVSLLFLNDDCLIDIFSYLELFDLIKIGNTCVRLNDIAHFIYKRRYTTFDFDNIDNNFKSSKPIDSRYGCVKLLTYMDARMILINIGSYITSIKISAAIFQRTNVRVCRIIELIPKYCKNLQHLSINQFPINITVLNKFGKIFQQLKSLNITKCDIKEKKLKCIQLHTFSNAEIDLNISN